MLILSLKNTILTKKKGSKGMLIPLHNVHELKLKSIEDIENEDFNNKIKKIIQTNKIKQELLEKSSKICLNPNRIKLLLEKETLSLDNIETLSK